MAAQTGITWIDGRDVATDFSFAISALAGWPGNLTAAKRTAPVLSGPEMNGGIYDPRLIVRQAAQATISGIVMGASVADALTKLDALRNLVGQGEVTVQTGYATDRYCYALCTDFVGAPFAPGILDGTVSVTMTFTVRSGVAERTTPDGIALSTTRVACPIGTADSFPIYVIHGGGATFSNPVITVRSAAGDIVQQMGLTIAGGATDALLVDSARAQVSKSAAGVITDALSDWTSGDFPTLRPYDAWVESAAYPTVELSSDTGTPVGSVTYTRRYL